MGDKRGAATARQEVLEKRPRPRLSASRAAWNAARTGEGDLRDIKREALLKAAVASFNRGGYHKTSLDDIARRLGITKTALYYYFPSKNALLAACFDRAMDLARSCLAESQRSGRSGRDRIVTFFRLYLQNITSEINENLLLTEEQALAPDERRALVRQRDEVEKSLRSLVEQGIADGSIVPCDPKLAVLVLLGAVNWVPKWYSSKGSWTPAQVSLAITQMLDRMLSTLPSAALPLDTGSQQ